MNITCVIITLNEEKKILQVLENASKICDEIIIIDSNSTDNTVKIAEQFGAKIYIQDFLGFGKQKNLGVKKAKNDWILNLDADELLDDLAIEEIKKMDLSNTDYDSFGMKHKNFLSGRFQPYLSIKDYSTRLFNKNKCKFQDNYVHEGVKGKNKKNMKGFIMHYSYDDYYSLIKKAPLYAKLGANDLFRRNKKATFFTPIYKSIFGFFKEYIIKRAFLNGLDGIVVCSTGAFIKFMKYSILLEKQRNEK